jgi:hypothetical protein
MQAKERKSWTRQEQKAYYALTFCEIMQENGDPRSLTELLEGPFGGWETAEMQLRIEEMEAEGMTDDEIQGACTALECMAGRKSCLIGEGPVAS